MIGYRDRREGDEKRTREVMRKKVICMTKIAGEKESSRA